MNKIQNKILITIFLISMHLFGNEKPNILWITSEDNSVFWLGCYGNAQATTPNLDKLASEGFQYENCFSNAPVCAPSRSGWITGIHSVSTGTNYMRSRYPIPHNIISYYPDLLKKAGYYVSNDKKTDYNIGGRNDNSPWDSMKTDWQTLKAKQPFFHVYNSHSSHESRAFGDVTKTKHDPEKMKLAPYHPDILTIRQNYAHYQDAVEKMDADMGDILKKLKENGLSENTIVIYNSDHGGVLPRSKRFLYNSGTHCPLIIRIPEKYKHLWPAEKPGSKVNRLVSFIDMPKTWLDLAGAEKPAYLQGKIFLGKNTEPEQQYHVSYRDRMDEKYDSSRAIRDKRYLLVRNYLPFVPGGQKLSYLWQMKATQAWEQHFLQGKTNDITGAWFKAKSPIEFYDTKNDPHCIENLAHKTEFQEIIKKMSSALDDWQRTNFDSGLLPENEIVERAEKNKLTIYELVRNPQLYNLPEYQKVANLAIEVNQKNQPELTALLSNTDSGVRYWSLIGLHLLQAKNVVDLEKVRPLLNDESHEVRSYAAWIFYHADKKEVAIETWITLIKQNSNSILTIGNMINWAQIDDKGLTSALQNIQDPKNEYQKRIKETIAPKK